MVNYMCQKIVVLTQEMITLIKGAIYLKKLPKGWHLNELKKTAKGFKITVHASDVPRGKARPVGYMLTTVTGEDIKEAVANVTKEIRSGNWEYHNCRR